MLFRIPLLLLLLPVLAVAQVDVNDFVLNGNAKRLDDECFRLTEAVDWQGGAIWYKKPIDLREPFYMELEVFLGCQDRGGADGIVFIFSPRARLGYSGEGMGFGGLAPSLGIELDTWLNDHLADPEEDHVAILTNGDIRHYRRSNRPNVLPNLEDCAYHPMEVSWDPAAQELKVYLDGIVVASAKGDLTQSVFLGNSIVYWGASAATGQYNNRQEVCFRKLVLGEAPRLPTLDMGLQRDLMQGQTIQIPGFRFKSGSTDLTAEQRSLLNGLAGLLRAHPRERLKIYAFTDDSGPAELNQRLSNQRAKVIAEYLAKRGIARERLVVRGFGEAYPRLTGSSAAVRMKNRRVEFSLVRAIP